MALRIALWEVRNLIEKGLTQADFEATRDYLMKNVFVMTATQDQQLGYALDSQWYGIPEYTQYMRERLAKLTLAEVNGAVKKHLSGQDLQVVMITKDGKTLAEQLIGDQAPPIVYEAPKPQSVLDEDEAIAAVKLGIRPDAVRIVPVEEVFAR
jgi:zinc protease